MKVVIRHNMDYQATVRQLFALLRAWNMSCYIDEADTDDEQTITDPKGVAATPTPVQQVVLLKTLPGVSLKYDHAVHSVDRSPVYNYKGFAMHQTRDNNENLIGNLICTNGNTTLELYVPPTETISNTVRQIEHAIDEFLSK